MGSIASVYPPESELAGKPGLASVSLSSIFYQS